MHRDGLCMIHTWGYGACSTMLSEEPCRCSHVYREDPHMYFSSAQAIELGRCCFGLCHLAPAPFGEHAVANPNRYR